MPTACLGEGDAGGNSVSVAATARAAVDAKADAEAGVESGAEAAVKRWKSLQSKVKALGSFKTEKVRKQVIQDKLDVVNDILRLGYQAKESRAAHT
jgi:hypothetical protein